jgi:hypothetical protein
MGAHFIREKADGQLHLLVVFSVELFFSAGALSESSGTLG